MDDEVFIMAWTCASPIMSFRFDMVPGVFGPIAEMRRLDDIRPSLRDPHCDGPDPVYGITMDVGREEHREDLRQRMLLLGAVVFAGGRLGEEPVRSQGHIHRKAPHSGWSPPELFEIWEGSAIIYAQETADDHPGRCFAISAGVGDQVVVPPGWAHCVINADPSRRMVFAAWCDREYGFDYRGVRAHRGLAWFPLLPQERELGPLELGEKSNLSPLRVDGENTQHISRTGTRHVGQHLRPILKGSGLNSVGL